MHNLYQYENDLIQSGFKLIAGIDEAGRGPLAGPLVVALVILPLNYELTGLNDSKQLTAKKRDLFYEKIIQNAIYYEIKIVTEKVIDELNIYQATKQAMIELAINSSAEFILTDAMPLNDELKHLPIIKGDSKSITIAAASVLAKVTRDKIMQKLHQKYPKYGFDKNKGYGTKAHMQAIYEYGPTPVHRKTYNPVASMLKQEYKK